MISKSNLMKVLGPGILFASTAIGVSHLVQSTRAGAVYGFGLLWAVLLANILKYPFFEFGSRYANVTGKSIIDGYKEMGKWMIWLYFLITIGSMFFVVGAIGIVTSGFLDNLFGIGNVKVVTPILFFCCLVILIAGRYKLLDSVIKIIAVVLLMSTLLAFIFTISYLDVPKASITVWEYEHRTDFLFMIALMGWMPTAVDLSAWNSLWTIERIKQTGYHPTLKQTLFDFNLGYFISAILSICFLVMGAYIIQGKGAVLPSGSAEFADTVVNMFTTAIGNWSYLLIAAAGFSIMFGTCLAVFDGYARAIDRTLLLLRNESNANKARSNYTATLLLIGAGSYIIIVWIVFIKQNTAGFRLLVDLATTISFLVAPIIAMANYHLVNTSKFPEKARPKIWLKVLSIVGILYLIIFSIVFFLY